VRDSALGCEKQARQFRAKFLARIILISLTMGFVHGDVWC
jgi:hypothetical protein